MAGVVDAWMMVGVEIGRVDLEVVGVGLIGNNHMVISSWLVGSVLRVMKVVLALVLEGQKWEEVVLDAMGNQVC